MECFQWDDPTIDVEGGCSTTRECKIRISGCPQLHVEAVQHFGVNPIEVVTKKLEKIVNKSMGFKKVY